MNARYVGLAVGALLLGTVLGYSSGKCVKDSQSLREYKALSDPANRKLVVDEIRWRKADGTYVDGEVIYAKSGDREVKGTLKQPGREFIQMIGTIDGQDFLAYYQTK